MWRTCLHLCDPHGLEGTQCVTILGLVSGPVPCRQPPCDCTKYVGGIRKGFFPLFPGVVITEESPPLPLQRVKELEERIEAQKRQIKELEEKVRHP